MSKPFDALVIMPGHGSEWLTGCRWEGGYVVGWADDYSVTDPASGRPERLVVNFPRNHVLRTTEAGSDE